MPDFDWRSPNAYAKIQNADSASFAWEYLRRNPDYQQHYRALENPQNCAPAEFRRRWGLTFRS